MFKINAISMEGEEGMNKEPNKSFKITTVNIPTIFLEHIDRILDTQDENEFLGFVQSRSEFVRHAVFEYIIKSYQLSDILSRKGKNSFIPRRSVFTPIAKIIDYNSKGINED